MKIAALPANRAIYVCQHVFERSRELDYVHYDGDGDILITCCGDDHDFTNSKEIHVVGLEHLTGRDPTLLDVPDLHAGEWAERRIPDRRWKVFSNKE